MSLRPIYLMKKESQTDILRCMENTISRGRSGRFLANMETRNGSPSHQIVIGMVLSINLFKAWNTGFKI